jgi:hypothetical protein
MYCSLTEPLHITSKRISDTVRRAFDMGDITSDIYTCIALLNSLNGNPFKSLQASVSRGLTDSTKAKPFTSADICRLMENQQTIINSKSTKHSSDIALATKGQHHGDLPGHNHGEGATCCTLCQSKGRPCHGHSKAWCIQKGGGMEGKTIEESRVARLAASGKGKGGAGKSPSSAGGKTFVAVKGGNGRSYFVDTTHLSKLQSTTPKPEFAGLTYDPTPTSSSIEAIEYHGFLALKEPKVSINWTTNSQAVDESALAVTIAPLQQKHSTPLVSIDTQPFYVDTGASVHISPIRSDFITL